MNDREARHRLRLRHELAEARRLGHVIAVGAPSDLFPSTYSTNLRGTETMNSPAPIRTPVPADIPKAIAAVTKALGLPADAEAATILAALEALFSSPGAIEQTALSAGLSAREARMLATSKGATVDIVSRYVANRRAMKRK